MLMHDGPRWAGNFLGYAGEAGAAAELVEPALLEALANAGLRGLRRLSVGCPQRQADSAGRAWYGGVDTAQDEISDHHRLRVVEETARNAQ